MNRVPLGGFRTLTQHTLQVEAARSPGQLVIERPCEQGKGLQLSRIRRRMDAAQEQNLPMVEMAGDRFVGGQHEVLDELMALVLHREVGSAYVPLLVVLQLRG